MGATGIYLAEKWHDILLCYFVEFTPDVFLVSSPFHQSPYNLHTSIRESPPNSLLHLFGRYFFSSVKLCRTFRRIVYLLLPSFFLVLRLYIFLWFSYSNHFLSVSITWLEFRENLSLSLYPQCPSSMLPSRCLIHFSWPNAEKYILLRKICHKWWKHTE